MLKIDKLTAKIGERKILDKFNIEIKDGEIHAIMGPNGTGKSTLSKIIMGSHEYNIAGGSIIFNGEDITNLEVDERSRKGIFLSMQNPISIEGVTNREFLRTALNARSKEPLGLFDFIKKMEKNIKDLDIKNEILTQNINDGVFQQKLKGQVTKYIKSVVTNAPTEHQIPVLQLERKILEISETRIINISIITNAS